MNKNLRQDINFFEAMGKDKIASSMDFMETMKKCIVIWVVVSVVVVSIALLSNVMLSSKVKRLTTENEQMQAELTEVNDLKLQSEKLKADIEKFNTAIKDFEVNPRLTVSDINNIAYARPVGLVIESMAYADNKITVNCSSPTELLSADYANNLRNSTTKNPNAATDGIMYLNNFKSVTYTGASGSAGAYKSTLIVELNDRGEVTNE